MTDKEKIYMDVCDPADKECVSYALSDVTFTGYFYPGSNTASMCKIRLSWCDDIMQTPIVSSVEILRDTDVWETITDDVEHDYLLDNLWPWIQDIRDSFCNDQKVCDTNCCKETENEEDIPGQKTFNFNNDGNVTVNLTTCLGRESLDKLNTIASNEEWYRYNGYQ